jgi:hypothetical protein
LFYVMFAINQIAEKELTKFMPATSEQEAVVGYDKFELGAVLIQDGFHVYEILKTTRAFVKKLERNILKDVLPADKLSIIHFYLRQIQVFVDVMADLGLFGLMQQVLDMYAIHPRGTKKKETPERHLDLRPAHKKKRTVTPPASPPTPPLRDPNIIYVHRTVFENGYVDPFAEPEPASPHNADLDLPPGEGEGEQDNDEIIYLDIKTGRIGKISRALCLSKQLIVIPNDETGQEELQGEIEDDDEKEQLIWELKKAMKKSSPSRSRSGLSSTGSIASDGNSPPTPKRGAIRLPAVAPSKASKHASPPRPPKATVATVKSPKPSITSPVPSKGSVGAATPKKSSTTTNAASKSMPTTGVTKSKPTSQSVTPPTASTSETASSKKVSLPYNRTKQLEKLKRLQLSQLKANCHARGILTDAMVEKNDFYEALLKDIERRQ